MALQADRQSAAAGRTPYSTTAASLPAGKRPAAISLTAKASAFAFTAQPSPRVEQGDIFIAAGHSGSSDASAADTAVATLVSTGCSASELTSASSAVSLTLGRSASSESFQQAPEPPSQSARAPERPVLPPLRTTRVAGAAATAAAAKEAAVEAMAESDEQRLARVLQELMRNSSQVCLWGKAGKRRRRLWGKPSALGPRCLLPLTPFAAAGRCRCQQAGHAAHLPC